MIDTIDLTCDMGESYGNFRHGADEELMPYISSANVACGFHAGDPVHMDRTVKLAKHHAVSVGVHFGLPDVAGFGRRRMDISTEEARAMTLYQIGALQAFANAHKVKIGHVLPHGVLYSMLAEETIARAVLSAIVDSNREWILFWPTPLQRHNFYMMAEHEGLRVVPAVTIDLDYRADGSVIVERIKQARDPSAISDRLQRFIETGKLATVDGKDMEFQAGAIIFHGDGPNAVDLARAIRATLDRMGIKVMAAATTTGQNRGRSSADRQLRA
jgi:5-oxoprolinase (ATP-hydrolysing) subunit A